jgi:glycosyltransferase involved in cell wall biosynthesis
VTSFSVIVSTYDRPEFLERVLIGYAMQSDRDFELVIADDGSGEATREVIQIARKSRGLVITHVRHEHSGFRKTIILNRSIVNSSGSYLMFTDGDCIPRRDLIATHKRLARRSRYVAGGYVKLPSGITTAITPGDIESGAITDLGWLKSRGWQPGRRALRLTRSWRMGCLYDFLTPTAADFHGNNASAFRDDIYAVNGFEGEMGYGGLDQALGYRLQNAGVKGYQARHRAVTMHLHHDRPYRNPDVVRKNREIMKRIKQSGESRARLGIAELDTDPTVTIDRG